MRVNNKDLFLNQQMSNSATSEPIQLGQAFGYAVQAQWTGSPAGTLKVQASCDNVDPTNWDDVTGVTQAVSGAGTKLFNVADVMYPWARVVYTSTATGAQTVTTVADVSSSLAGAYFLLTSASLAQKYAVWFKVGGAGTAPVVSGYTAEEVDISANATASAVATAMAAVVDALSGFDAAAVGAVVTVTNTAAGPFTVAVDGAIPTGFAFAATTGAGVLNCNAFYRGF